MRTIPTIFYLLMALVTSSCLRSQKQAPKQPLRANYQGQAFSPFYLTDKDLGFKLESKNIVPFNPRHSLDQQKDILWALASTDRLNGHKAQSLAHLITQKGVLPQALVPVVRKEIQENPMIQTVLGSIFGNISRIFADVFFQDSQLSSMVRKSLSERMAKVFPTSVDTSLAWRFDLFVPHKAQRTAMTMEDQAVLWNLSFALPTMWQDPNRFLWPNDHGLQLLWISRVVAEWSYIFGIETSGLGGLTFMPQDRMKSQAQLGPYDPRVSVDPIRWIGGEYVVRIPTSSTFGLALEAKETWERNLGALTLGEQVRILQSFARAYDRMRPSARRAHMNALYTQLLPDGVHELSFVFVAGFAELLQKHLIHTDNTLFEDTTRTRPAEFLSLVRLVSATDVLLDAFSSYEQDRLSLETRSLVEENVSVLKDIARMAVQNIFLSYVTLHNPQTASITFQESVTTSMALEALVALNQLDQKHFDFDSEIRLKILSLNHWFMAFRLQDHPSWNLADLSYLYELTRSLKAFGNDTHKAPWVEGLYRQLDELMTKLEDEMP